MRKKISQPKPHQDHDVEFIKHGLKKKVDIDEFAALERRVALLERRR